MSAPISRGDFSLNSSDWSKISEYRDVKKGEKQAAKKKRPKLSQQPN